MRRAEVKNIVRRIGGEYKGPIIIAFEQDFIYDGQVYKATEAEALAETIEVTPGLPKIIRIVGREA